MNDLIAVDRSQTAQNADQNLQHSHNSFISSANTSELGRLTCSFDWSTTPVGPIHTWPQSLITMVRTILSSRYPMWLAWGKELTMFYNDAYAHMTLGPKHPWALGRSFREVWSEIWDEVGPRAEAVLTTGISTWDEGLLLFLERNGFPEETYHTFSYSPAYDDRGNIGGILCVVTEDTERTIGERRLRTLRELAARTNEEAKSLDDACQAAAHILKKNPKDVTFSLLYLLNDDESKVSLVASCGIETGTPLSPESLTLTEVEQPWPFVVTLKSGDSTIVSEFAPNLGPLPGGPWPEPSPQAIVVPLAKSVQSQFSGFLVVGISARRPLDDAYRGFVDLIAGQVSIAINNAQAYEEERRRAEALAELNRAKTVFFSNVSHEFRTPLTLMLGPIEEMLNQAGELNHREALEMIYRNGLRLQRLVNTLLDFSKIEAGRAQACFAPVDIASLTTDLASNFIPLCTKGGLDLVIECEPLNQPVYLDEDMWEKIVFNLLSNAFKFTFAGIIHLSLRQLDHTVELIISDTGIGIPEGEMPRLFERFHRVEQSQGRTHEGSGIGLALVNELVKLHKGSITATSKVGKGTTLTVTLPLGASHLPPNQIGSRNVDSSSRGAQQFIEEALHWLPEIEKVPELKFFHNSSFAAVESDEKQRPRILLVDDNADMRNYLIRLLTPTYQVDAACNGKEALALVQKSPPSLIISDAMMPHLDGFGLLKELRANTHTAPIPVIMLSARAGEESRIEGMHFGADEYLVKPFSARVLLASVASHLRMARLREESNQAIRESEERFRALIKATSDIVYRMSADWTEMWYLEGRDFIMDTLKPSINWLDKYIHQDDQELVKQTIQRSIESKDVFELEHRVFRVDGSLGWTHSRAIPILNKDKEIVEWFGVASDVTLRKNAEQSLLESSRHKDEFLATLAHELRNPLAPIFNALEILRRPTNNPQLIEKSQEIIERQLVQMDRLINDLLDLSRISHGKIHLRIEQIELAKIIQQAIESSSPLIEAANHHLQVDLPPIPIYLNADLTRLAQVFANLLNNAAKYTGPGGFIHLTAKLQKEQVVVSVLDDGIGIPQSMLSNIFDKFTQVNRGLERAQGGLGIGLSLVKQLVELHGGTVTAKSKGESLGSEFVVRLPIIVSNVYSGELNRKFRSFTNIRRILVVDDNIDIVRSLEMLLSVMGHNTQTACNGVEAINAARTFHPDLILMDIGMPQLNGYEVAKEIRKQSWGEKITIVALTGWGQEQDKQQAKEAGFDFHITKPIKIDRLEKLLANLDFEL
ncbi:ATP-binding protein [Legionella sp. km772]|uniref:ATP-binding protein n=1 Tax=Legionella sp. km772 TaxID=2498111 RepID=UPI000F8D67A0|nr:ATP-binding protein [Legionella sp. km772]RUR11643.1 response regulator [Legionella sp. km772]